MIDIGAIVPEPIDRSGACGTRAGRIRKIRLKHITRFQQPGVGELGFYRRAFGRAGGIEVRIQAFVRVSVEAAYRRAGRIGRLGREDGESKPCGGPARKPPSAQRPYLEGTGGDEVVIEAGVVILECRRRAPPKAPVDAATRLKPKRTLASIPGLARYESDRPTVTL
jgi:hypothetical protein